MLFSIPFYGNCKALQEQYGLCFVREMPATAEATEKPLAVKMGTLHV